MKRSPKRPKPGAALSRGDIELFRRAVHGATPLSAPKRIAYSERPPAVPVQSLLDAHATLSESIRGPIPWEQSMETGEELAFLREGLARDTLRKLRRGHWTIQDEIDLHGQNREQAKALLAEFLKTCVKRKLRCVRVVHGKGLRSPRREPVLKAKVNQWLAQRDEVLAFCQAPAASGGGGALLLLLKARTGK
ncbi:MAG: Smr/MutS family protein [Betaproteobacteria bacterium]|nr:Smr/MutS family protein [Betaproteobacteria bacterium]MBI2958728.1 Smr/MutS family protein [Betaproteobacteria bacterium]